MCLELDSKPRSLAFRTIVLPLHHVGSLMSPLSRCLYSSVPQRSVQPTTIIIPPSPIIKIVGMFTVIVIFLKKTSFLNTCHPQFMKPHLFIIYYVLFCLVPTFPCGTERGNVPPRLTIQTALCPGGVQQTRTVTYVPSLIINISL